MSDLLLCENNLDPEQTELISDIKSATDFMLSLLKDLLDVSAIESGKLNLQLESVDIKKYVERIVKRYRMISKLKNIQIKFEIKEPLPPISIDRNKFEQVLVNLLTNAIKFSHSDTIIQVSVTSDQNQVLFKVEDHGQGIPTSEREKLFKPFSLTSVKSTAGEPSTGLGLAITQKLVLAHDGQISVESEVGKGSIFSVSIPIK